MNSADTYLDNSPLDNTSQTELVGKLELLEERAKVITNKTVAGKVTVQKHVRTRTVDIPVELEEEYLTVQLSQGDTDAQAFLDGSYDEKDIITYLDETTPNVVTINGKPLIAGEPVEIVLSRQTAVVIKRTYAVEEVALHTYTDTKTHTLATTLRREELHVDGEDYIKTDHIIE